ncbi:hypothetical protein IV203_001468 [Nitzschia inconspicua]|uniref:F5/8 type C domain-containing protein n=1 Tax=Nitzschia inconspicua TaxID=303405 RepID=A0A9K3L729_9STRA|nr:hypothetical protein IV203_001468 [Nitzschia inconspicua]
MFKSRQPASGSRGNGSYDPPISPHRQQYPYEDDGSRSSPSKKKKKKKKKKHKHEGYEGEYYPDPEKKRKSVTKMRMRLWGRSKKKGVSTGAEDVVVEYYDPTQSNAGAIVFEGNIPSASYRTKAGFNSGTSVDGSFQLDNVLPVGSSHVMGNNTLQKYETGGPPTVSRKIDVADADDLNKRFRVKPFHSFPSPTYMNETELYQCMMAPSTHFEFLTSYLNPSTKGTRRAKVPDAVRHYFGTPREDGRIGSLRVEILGCVGLDRLKPDVAVYAVCGDCAFASDVIGGYRSPMWPNSAKRAAVFPLHHAYARLFLGIFDINARKANEPDFFCGRVAIDIPQLRPNTEYDVTFPLRVSAFIYDRRPRGVVRVRFSLHWFSERAAILSYLKRPRNPLAFSKQAKKQPTIPCGDPKTFRNVAVTVHGQDFPGKYTRPAFRATMREFNLSQQNIRFLLKVLILDCILYENPIMSLYLFITNMYCVYQNSVRLVPPFFVGWLIYLFIENHNYFNGGMNGHLGYQPLTVKEVFYALIRNGKGGKQDFHPILVKKRARRSVVGEDGKLIDIELQNHREFPFSERFEYPKFAAADAIAASPSTNKKKKGDKGATTNSTDLRTARRLSIYVTPVDDKGQTKASADESDDSESEENDSENEGEGMMDEDDEDGYGKMDDSDDEDDSEDDDEDGSKRKKAKKKARLFEAGQASKTRRIRVGPPQNSDKSGRKLPPQAHLSKVELMLHRASKNISVEHVHFPPPHVQTQLGKDVNAKGPAGDVLTAKEKQHFDEFDRLLGYRTKNPNPIVRITSSFLGPLMRIIRIVIYAVRISFNVCSWRDPYLTFWVFAFLCILAFVLLIFPWRTFFFLSTLVLLGPQNIAVRKYLERRAREREQEEKEEKEKEDLKAQLASGGQDGQSQLIQQTAMKEEMEKEKNEKAKKKRGLFGRNRKKEEEDEMREAELKEAELYQSPRPAFYAHTKPTRRNQIPRDVAVPYFRFRKDRFFDWPPDPTVSRATPIVATLQSSAFEDENEDPRQFSSQVPKVQSAGFGNQFPIGQPPSMHERDLPTSLRNRGNRGGDTRGRNMSEDDYSRYDYG